MMRFLYEGFVRLIGFIFQLIGLVFICLVSYGLYKLFLILGDRIIPLFVMLSLLLKRIATVVWLSSRFHDDRTDTWDRMINPQYYEGRPVTLNDRVSRFVIKSIPNLRSLTDMADYPLPFGLWEGQRVWSYIRKTTFWNLLTFSSLGYWLIRGWGLGFLILFKVWSIILIAGLLLTLLSSKFKRVEIYYKKRFLIINMDLSELVEKLSLGVIKRKVRWWRKKRIAFITALSLFSWSVPRIVGFIIN